MGEGKPFEVFAKYLTIGGKGKEGTWPIQGYIRHWQSLYTPAGEGSLLYIRLMALAGLQQRRGSYFSDEFPDPGDKTKVLKLR